jgi:hypothetical protein
MVIACRLVDMLLGTVVQVHVDAKLTVDDRFDPAVLVPSAVLIASLGHHPGDRCTYCDRDGVGLALVTWRAEYDTSEYELARPRLRGSEIVIRPDLLERLANGAGQERLVLRDFVVGVPELAGTAS